MELHKAIGTALHFVPSGKSAAEILKSVRFFSPGANVPSYIYSTDGITGVVIPVDVPCFDMLIDGASLGPVKTHPIESLFVDPHSGTSSATMKLKGTGGYALTYKNPQAYPDFPAYPERMAPIPNVRGLLQVAHAALKAGETIRGTPRPDLECVHFLPDRVEATDTYRMALADLSLGFTAKIHRNLFKHWPKGDAPVSVAITDTHAWFKIGDEMRFCALQEGTYASGRNLREHVTVWHDGPSMVIDTKEFLDVIKRAERASLSNVGALDFGLFELGIQVLDAERGFSEKISGRPGLAAGSVSEYPTFGVNLKHLVEALRSIPTPKVRVCYGGAANPLRLESGSCVECLWPKGLN